MALNSEENAKTYETNAKASENQSQIYEQYCNDHNINCKNLYGLTQVSEANAKTSEQNAGNYEDLCKYYYDQMSVQTLVLGETSRRGL